MVLSKLLQGRYQVVQFLGAGGFCQTYLAEDIHQPDHPICVVKHLQPSSNQLEPLANLRRLFLREAQALQKLGKHDQVPQLLAYFEQDQEFYLVEEYILGNPLSTELESSDCWSERQVVQLLQDVLGILKFVHSYGLIHRDLKPSNLIRRQQDGRIVLIDFGVVKQAWTQVVTVQGKTCTSFAIGMPATIAIGTPGYMPSEQGLGRPRPNSDIYALGMIAIKALTGLHPRKLPKATDSGEVIWQHQADVSPHLACVLDKMVRYHFQDRYQTTTEALQALQPLVNLYLPTQHPSVSMQSSMTAAPMPPTPSSKTDISRFVRENASQTQVCAQTRDAAINTSANKSVWSVLLLGISIGFACALALISGSCYFQQPSATVPQVQKKVE